MSRAQRLLDLIQILRRHRFPVTGQALAAELGISLRTLYRDIATLQAQGAPIDGEAGLGYVLRAGFMLPPLMFSSDEIEALVLGTRWVMRHSQDQELIYAAQDALTKINAVIPPELKHLVDSTTLLIGPGKSHQSETIDLAQIRKAIRQGVKITLDYQDQDGQSTTRIVWPFALGFFEQTRILAAWCELRQGYRHFRTDRITQLEVMATPYPKPRQTLLREWQQTQGITLYSPPETRA